MLHVLRLAINNELFARPPRTAGDEWLLDITDNGFPLLLYYINVLRYAREKYDVVPTCSYFSLSFMPIFW